MAEKRNEEKSFPLVELLGTECRTFVSPSTAEEFKLHISFPHSYWYPEKRSKYPVIYSLNAQWDFQIISGIYGNLNFDGLIEEIIIVGITWGGEYPDYVKLANRDFTPTNSKYFPGSGGSDRFLKVLQEEIVPFIQQRISRYRRPRINWKFKCRFVYILLHVKDTYII